METDPFRIRGHVADFDAVVEDIVAASARTRGKLPMLADVAYGDGPSEALDIFFPNGPRDNLPVHMFIHGGYWRMWSKREYSCVANTVTQAGAIAVIVDYALMPRFRMDVLVDQIVRAGQWVGAHVAEHGGNPSDFTVSGHSAGAHLASFLLHKNNVGPHVKGALLLGGLYDLKPLQHSFLEAEIALSDDEVARFTPLGHSYNDASRVTLAVGQQETAPFHDQMAQFSEVLRRQNVQCQTVTLIDHNHMSAVRDLGDPQSHAGELLRGMIGSRSF